MLILLEGQFNCGTLVLNKGERTILLLEDRDRQFFELYPGLTHLYPLKDVWSDKKHYLYTKDMKNILKDGTIL